MTELLLKTRHNQTGEIKKIRAGKPLKPLNHGDIVHMRLPPDSSNDNEWQGAGQVVGQVAPRSVVINGAVYRRNQCHLLAPLGSPEEDNTIQQQQEQQWQQQPKNEFVDSNLNGAEKMVTDASEQNLVDLPLHHSECVKTQTQRYGWDN